MTSKTVTLWGAILGFLAVALGAFGAHALRTRLDERALEIFHTAVQYQMLHALLLVFLGERLARKERDAWTRRAAALAVGGVVVFSGSLYLLVATGTRVLGAVTPLGGVMFLGAWLCLALSVRGQR